MLLTQKQPDESVELPSQILDNGDKYSAKLEVCQNAGGEEESNM